MEVIPGSHKRIIPAILTGDTSHARRFAGRAADPAHVDDRIGVHVEETIRPCDVNPSSPDGRSLGLAIHRIALTPLG